MNRGKLTVISILLLAIALAALALWWNISSGQRTLTFWGSEAGARIIAPAAVVELLWLQPAGHGAGDERLLIDGHLFVVSHRVNVTGVRGLVHARHALLEDASFVWDADAATTADYTVAARFRNGEGTTTVAFDFAREQLTHVESGREVKGAAKIVAGWRAFAVRYAPHDELGTE